MVSQAYFWLNFLAARHVWKKKYTKKHDKPESQGNKGSLQLWIFQGGSPKCHVFPHPMSRALPHLSATEPASLMQLFPPYYIFPVFCRDLENNKKRKEKPCEHAEITFSICIFEVFFFFFFCHTCVSYSQHSKVKASRDGLQRCLGHDPEAYAVSCRPENHQNWSQNHFRLSGIFVVVLSYIYIHAQNKYA